MTEAEFIDYLHAELPPGEDASVFAHLDECGQRLDGAHQGSFFSRIAIKTLPSFEVTTARQIRKPRIQGAANR